MSQMTVLGIFLVLIVGFGAVYVVIVARETERTHPELGDLPAALLTIFFVVIISFTVEKFQRLNAKIESAQLAEGFGQRR